MKTDELMIGDWVNYNGENFKIISIGLFTQVGIMDSNNDVYSAFAKDLVPIPLTTEILKKNGFMCIEACLKPKYAKYVCRNICVIFANNNFVSIPPCLGMKCGYVHELQHALRLCGIDKEIEI